VLLATDPAHDLAPSLASGPDTNWAELSEMYVTTDTTNLYVYVALPNYSPITAVGQVGLAIDTTGDLPDSGGALDPRSSALTFAYAVTHANTGTVPLDTTHIILPEILIRGRIVGATVDDTGFTAFYRWNGSAWIGGAVNWGGIAPITFVGTHIAYATGFGVEFFIPYADLQVPPEAPLHLQFFTAGHTVFSATGAYDTVPADDQATAVGDPTEQHRLASLLPAAPPPPLPCASAALGDNALVSAGLAHDDTDLAYRDPLGGLPPGAAATLRLRACANDVQAVDLLVWATADPLASAPTHTYGLTATVAADYAVWTGPVTAPLPGGDQWYQFRLTDGGAPSYFQPLTTSPGPGQWSASLQAPSWYLPTLPGLALFVPLVVRP